MIPLFDLHCDTLLEAYNKNCSLIDNELHVSINKASFFEPYYQVFSVWSDYRLQNDAAYNKALYVIEHFKHLGFKNFFDKNTNFILGIEDARLLNGNISRLFHLFSLGLTVLTLNWKGESCIGGGYDTDIGLTDFGKEVLIQASKLKIVIDLSHSSHKVFKDTVGLAEKYDFTPIASHSCSYSVNAHKRNLTDDEFCVLRDLGSVVGISFAKEHLGGNADFEAICKHINHYLSLDGENCIALGCDFDGVSSLPTGIDSIQDLTHFYQYISSKFGKKISDKIFFQNAFRYFNERR